MDKPTCQQICDEELDDPVLVEDDTSWRHGYHRYAVYHRKEDNTFWSVNYRASTDGETNELREGTAKITEVTPVQKTITVYEEKQ